MENGSFEKTNNSVRVNNLNQFIRKLFSERFESRNTNNSLPSSDNIDDNEPSSPPSKGDHDKLPNDDNNE